MLIYGPVAQLGERRVRNAEVEGSSPFGSTIIVRHKKAPPEKPRFSSAFFVIAQLSVTLFAKSCFNFLHPLVNSGLKA